MNYIQALLLSFVEGITEFLPISSTGHLILASKLLLIPQTEFVKSFEIIIQLGAILAVVVLYFKKVLKNTRIWSRITVAFIPTGIIGLILYKVIKKYLIGNLNVVIVSLLVGGVAMLIIEELFKKRNDSKTLKIENLGIAQSGAIGIAQALSVIPGVSRAMVTIFGGLGVGLSRENAVEFSFLLAVPTMAAATTLDLVKTRFHFTTQEYLVLSVGFIGAFISALLAIRYFIRFVQNHIFRLFAFYRIALAILFWMIYK